MLHSGMPGNLQTLDFAGRADKLSSLLQKSVNYGRKKFYSAAPWPSMGQTLAYFVGIISGEEKKSFY